ncbi:MAG: PQQ-binding-like beta-propeller repeat protein [Planctomycetia bacterium]
MSLLVLFAMCAEIARAGEWPQILGPDRSGAAAADESLADAWPAAGPPVVWRREVGAGYAGVAVAGGRVILFHRVGGEEVVESLDCATAKTLWRAVHPTAFTPQVGGGDGPLCVPLVHDGRVIVFGAQGVLRCLDAATGAERWRHDTHREFGAQEGYFGAGSTPVVAAGNVIVNVGGSRQGAGVVAFALDTGAVVWKATAEPASYSAPVVTTVGGTPHVLMVTRFACLLLDPRSGDIRWQFPFGQRGPTVNAASPVTWPDSRLLVTAAYGIGSVCASFDAAGSTKLWEGVEPLATQYCTPIALSDEVYCVDGRDDVPPAALKCLDARTGRVRWTEPKVGYGTLLAADGKLIVAQADGTLLLVHPNPDRCEILARARPLDGTVRALPALATGRLFLRDDATLVCLDVAGRSHRDEGAHRPDAD